jgi:Protein of unknown function (DUF3892)
MSKGRKIIDARNAPDKTISHVKIEGNQRFTPIKTAIGMAKRGEISNAHAVNRSGAKEHLRTNADGKERNNLDYLAED